MQRLTRAPIATLSLMIAALASPAAAQDKPKPAAKHMVRFSFKEGTVRHSMLVQDITTKLDMGGEDAGTVMTMAIWFTTTVKSTKGNVAQLEQVITRVKAKVEKPEPKVDYDSDDPDSDPGSLEASVTNIVGKKVCFKLDDFGNLSDLELPKGDTATNRNFDGLRRAMLQGVTQLPGHPIAIGDKWRTKGKSKLATVSTEEMMIATETELVAVGKNSITVKQKQTIENDEDVPNKVVLETVQVDGTYTLDLRTGAPTEATIITRTQMKKPLVFDVTVKQTILPAGPSKAKSRTAPPTEAKRKPKAGNSTAGKSPLRPHR